MSHFLSALLVCLLFLSAPAMAQESMGTTSKIPAKPDTAYRPDMSLEELSSEKPPETFASKRTDNITVAMLFHKITGQSPDFSNWASQSIPYKNADPTEKNMVMSQVMDKLKTKFALMGYDEPVHVESYITLRQFRPEAGGFFVNEFKNDTYFTYSFDDENYAVIPTDIMDYEFIKLSPEKMEEMAQHITNKNQLFMRLSLTPLNGDASEKTRLNNGFENWLMAARVMDIELWSPKDKTLLWRSNEDFYSQKNKLLNLYR
tara:strand:+ start:1646 stop:2425 length:780 start_codon:yes stop_codon:yes gene_type:complete